MNPNAAGGPLPWTCTGANGSMQQSSKRPWRKTTLPAAPLQDDGGALSLTGRPAERLGDAAIERSTTSPIGRTSASTTVS